MKDFSLSLKHFEVLDSLLLAGLLLAVGLFVFWVWRRETLPRRRFLMFVLRLGGLLLVLTIFLQPILEHRVRLKDVPVAVLVDRSQSMLVTDGASERSQSRWQAVLTRLEKSRPFLERQFSPVYYLFDKDIRRVSWEEVASAKPRGSASNLAGLENVLRDVPGLRAVLLFSDGRGGGGKDPLPVVARLGLPVHTVGVGHAAPDPDLILDSIQTPHFAFKNTEVEVGVRIRLTGFYREKVSVKLTHKGKTVATTAVALSTFSDLTETTLRFQPRKTGLLSYQVKLPAYREEFNHQNNKASFTLQVSRDRIRVLYICGRPGPNYSFLRHQLKSNPSVDLVSFVILRDPQDIFNVSENELSLIPFPRQHILFEQLHSFDAVILEEFAFRLFGIRPAGLTALREFVEKGGGLLLMGDSELLGNSSPYLSPSIEPILPVAMNEPLVQGPQRFMMEVREPNHPVMALADDVSESLQHWSRMASLEGDGRFWSRVKTGAVLLAGWRSPDGISPVLAVWQRGRGRVMMFLSLSSWQWALQESGRGHGTWIYQRFWSNVLRWVSSSEDFRLVRLDVPQRPVSAGENVLLRATVRDESHRPLDSALVRATVIGPKGQREQMTFKSLGQGEYGGEKIFEDAGNYRVLARAFSRSKRLGQDEKMLRVGLLWDENHDTSTNFLLLDRLSKTSGGEFIPLEQYSAAWLADRLESAAWTFERREALWNSPWILAALIGFLLAEWILRRKWGRV